MKTRLSRSRYLPAALSAGLAALLLGCGGGAGKSGAASPSRPAAGETSEAGLTERIAGELRRKLPGATVAVTGPLTLVISLEDGRKILADVTKPWRACKLNADQCDGAVAWFVNGTTATLDAPREELHAEQLRVVLRSRGDLEAAREINPTIVAAPWQGELQIVLVFDLPKVTRMVEDADLAKLKLGRDKAMAIGKENTSREVAGDAPQEMGPVHAFAGGAYDASRLLVGTDWAKIARTVKGDLLVAAPARDLVLFTGTKEPFGLEDFRGLAEHMKGHTQFPLSSAVLRWTPKGFQVAAAK